MKASGAYKPCAPPKEIPRIPPGVDPFAKVAETMRDAAIIATPFALLGTDNALTASESVVPGTPQKLYTNAEDCPVIVAIQASPTASAQPGFLIIANDAPSCAIGKAKVYDFGPGPKASIILAPNESVVVDVTDPDGGAGPILVRAAAWRLPSLGRG